MSAPAEVVLAGLDDDRPADDRVRTDQLDLSVLDVDVRDAVLIGLDVS